MSVCLPWPPQPHSNSGGVPVVAGGDSCIVSKRRPSPSTRLPSASVVRCLLSVVRCPLSVVRRPLSVVRCALFIARRPSPVTLRICM